MVKFAKTFGMKVIYFDPYIKITNLLIKRLVKKSDVISLHAHVSEETKYMINKKF